MTKKPETEYSEKEAKARFESAVDVALRTPPMHRESKPKAKPKKTAAKKAKR